MLEGLSDRDGSSCPRDWVGHYPYKNWVGQPSKPDTRLNSRLWGLRVVADLQSSLPLLSEPEAG